MKLGFFTMPVHPLDKDWRVSLREDREAFLLADQLGFVEGYVGEHATDRAENITSSAVFIASLIDATYRYGFARLAGKLPPDTFGGYPTQYYSTAYNAGYGEWGLASSDYRDQGILSYEFMISNGQSGPYSWWESQQFPNAGSPWIGTHPEAGNGSSPHAWGMANASMVLLDSLAAQRADGSLIVGRGVPAAWLRSGQVISLANFPTVGGKHIGLKISTSGVAVTLRLSGQQPAGSVLFQLPAFVGNIAHASAGTVNEATGTVTLPATVRTVTVQLKHAA